MEHSGFRFQFQVSGVSFSTSDLNGRRALVEGGRGNPGLCAVVGEVREIIGNREDGRD